MPDMTVIQNNNVIEAFATQSPDEFAFILLHCPSLAIGRKMPLVRLQS
jgi:hypothetical protein